MLLVVVVVVLLLWGVGHAFDTPSFKGAALKTVGAGRRKGGGPSSPLEVFLFMEVGVSCSVVFALLCAGGLLLITTSVWGLRSKKEWTPLHDPTIHTIHYYHF